MESYHRQPHAKKADNRLKTAEESDHCPPTISIVPYPLQQRQEEKNHVQSRHPPQAGAQINCTGPTLHTAEPHTEEKYDPARQRNSQRPSTLKKTRDGCNKKIKHTHKTPPTNTTKRRRRKSHQKKDNIQRKRTI